MDTYIIKQEINRNYLKKWRYIDSTQTRGIAHTVHINSFELVYNEHPKGIGEFFKSLANTGVLNCLLEFLAGNFPILEVGVR